MSLLPLLLNELDELYNPPHIVRRHFMHPMLRSLKSGYLRPRRLKVPGGTELSCSISSNKDSFKVSLDVQQFKPDELKVRVVDDFLVVEAKHEERSDEHGFISRQFTRRYKLPEDIDSSALTSKLSSDGVLSLEAPKKALPESNVREIPITHTNAPAVKHQEETKKTNSEEMDEN